MTKCVEFTGDGKPPIFLFGRPTINVERRQATQIRDSEDLEHVDHDGGDSNDDYDTDDGDDDDDDRV